VVAVQRDLRERTKDYALRIIKLSAELHGSLEADMIRRQLLRSGTSVGAHYREGCRAKSDADFVSKVTGALQELDESAYWMELLMGGGFVPATKLTPLFNETNELIAIFTTVVKNVKNRSKPFEDSSRTSS
jgi:four helix bundle protein